MLVTRKVKKKAFIIFFLFVIVVVVQIIFCGTIINNDEANFELGKKIV